MDVIAGMLTVFRGQVHLLEQQLQVWPEASPGPEALLVNFRSHLQGLKQQLEQARVVLPDAGLLERQLRGQLTDQDYDTDHNGKVEEWERILGDNAAGAARDRVDSNRDGRLSGRELKAAGATLWQGDQQLDFGWYDAEYQTSDVSKLAVKRDYHHEELSLARIDEDVRALKAAFDYTGFFGTSATDEDGINRVLCNRSNREIQLIKARYEATYGQSLHEAIDDETSGDYRVGLFKLLEANRDETGQIDPAQIKLDAQAMHDAINDAPWWWPVKPEHDVKVPNLDVNLSKELDWHPGGMNVSIHISHDQSVRFGGGTDEDVIYRLLAGRSPAQIRAIAASYKEQFGEDLIEDLDGDFDGDSWDLIRAILREPEKPPAPPPAPSSTPTGVKAQIMRLPETSEHQIGLEDVYLNGNYRQVHYLDLDRDGRYTIGVDGILTSRSNGWAVTGQELEGDRSELSVWIDLGANLRLDPGDEFSLDAIPDYVTKNEELRGKLTRRCEFVPDGKGGWKAVTRQNP